MRTSLMIDKDLAQEIVECGYGIGEPYKGITVVAINSIDKGRWVEYMQLVVRDDTVHDGGLYAAIYEVGLTENQDYEPFEHSSDPVEFKPVWKVTKYVEEVTYHDNKETIRQMVRDGADIDQNAEWEITEAN